LFILFLLSLVRVLQAGLFSSTFFLSPIPIVLVYSRSSLTCCNTHHSLFCLK
jgi:hypothetical protein